MGGCAMGKDPKTSVVDGSTLRHHELDNLFVVDGSVCPTSLTVNPQLSIYGLASWASEHVQHAV
jgi:choline dehydrogenase-like flavoprotein